MRGTGLSSQFDNLARYIFSGGVRVLSVAANFVFSVVVTRALSIDDAGTFFLMFAILSVLSFVLGFGLENYVVRLVGITSASVPKKVGINRLIKIVAPVILFGLVVAVIVSRSSEILSEQVFANASMSEPFSIIVFGVAAMTGIILVGAALQGLMFISTSIFVTRIMVPMIVGLLIGIAHVDTLIGLSKVFLVVVWSVVLLGGSFLYLAWPSKTNASKREPSERRGHPRLSAGVLLSLAFIGIFQQLSQWSGQLIAGVFLPSSDVAVLAVSQRTALLVSFVLITINAVNAPRFARLASQDRAGLLHDLARRSNLLIIGIGTIAFLVVFVNSALILSLFGSEFAVNTMPLKILVSGQLVNILAGSVTTLLVMTGNYRASALTAGTSVCVSVVLGFLLVQAYGLIGICVAMISGIILKNLLDIIWVRRRLGFYLLARPSDAAQN